MYTALKNLSHFSLRHSIQKPEGLVKRAKELGMSALALTDQCSLAGAMEFNTECGKESIKPIYGLKLHTNSGYITVLAQNQQGWKNLIKLVTKSNLNFIQDQPTTTLSMLQEHSDGLIAICGAPHSIIANHLVSPTNQVDPTLINDAANLVLNLKDIFNKKLFIDLDASSTDRLILALRAIGQKTNTSCVTTSESIFSSLGDADDYKILACTDLKCTLKDLTWMHEGRYFRSIDNLKEFTQEEIANSQLIADMCEAYNITSKPRLPKFCLTEQEEREYLKKLIYNSERYQNTSEFNSRIEYELSVINGANLDGYFLIVQDYVNFAKKNGWLVGPGRGSAAGSLVSYLIGITSINPLPYHLSFERFYNPGRNTKDHVSYPDIDCDFPINKREEVINYIKDKYGHDKVAQMITFGRLQGAGALKEVLRAHQACDNTIMNKITEEIPDEASIADELEADDEDSIIRWVLNNRPKVVEEYARMNDDGEIVGDYAQYFEQAIRIEGVYRNSGKHAAGIVISPEPLEDVCPMVMDNKREILITGWEMKAIEKILIKMDILGVAALDKLQYARDLIRGTI